MSYKKQLKKTFNDCDNIIEENYKKFMAEKSYKDMPRKKKKEFKKFVENVFHPKVEKITTIEEFDKTLEEMDNLLEKIKRVFS